MAGSIATVLVAVALLSGLLYLQQPAMIFFPYSTLDAILYCLEKGAPTVEMNRLFGEKRVKYVSMLHENAGKLARLPFVPQPVEPELVGLSDVETAFDTQKLA